MSHKHIDLRLGLLLGENVGFSDRIAKHDVAFLAWRVRPHHVLLRCREGAHVVRHQER